METIKKRKILIEKIMIEQLEANRQFEIRLPANATCIKSILITASTNPPILNG